MYKEKKINAVVQSVIPIWLFWNSMDCSTPGLPVHHQLPESTQTHVYRVGDAIQPSQSLSFPSPSALNLSQHQGLFQWGSSSYQVAKVLELKLQHVFPIYIQDWFPLGDRLDLLAVQETLKSFFQHHSSKASPSSHLILYHPLHLLPSIFPIIRVFSNESAVCIRWPKY